MNDGLRRVFGAATVCALLGGLAACSEGVSAEEPEASVAAEGTEAPSGEQHDAGQDAAEDQEPIPASSEGPAENWPEPEFPAEASEKTEEGVEAALQYWFETRQYARNTGDVGPLEEVSDENCAFCNDQIEQVEDAYEQGWYVQELDEIDDIFVRVEDEYVATAIFLLTQGSYEAYVDGELVGESEAQEEKGWSVALVYEEERWTIADLVYVGPENDLEGEE